MKKIIALLFIVFTLNSCSKDDEPQKFHYEIIPVASFEVPDNFMINQIYPIVVRYNRPTDCHYFDGFYYDKHLNIRTIAIQSTVLENGPCTNTTAVGPIEVSFNFMPTQTGSYVFKFYKGKDADGNNIFEEVEIPVI